MKMRDCPRCTESHRKLKLRSLARPMYYNGTSKAEYFVYCAKTHQPVIVTSYDSNGIGVPKLVTGAL